MPLSGYSYLISKIIPDRIKNVKHKHTRTQTGRCEGLNDILGEETADISQSDAQLLNIAHGEMIKVSSRRGQVIVKAKVTREVPPGMVWMAFGISFQRRQCQLADQSGV